MNSNTNKKISYSSDILSIAENDSEFRNIVEKVNQLEFKELEEDKKGHNCFSDTAKELYPELFENREAKEIRYMLAYGLYLFQKDKTQDEKRFLIQDFEELLATGREVDINVGIAALKGLGKDLYVALPIGEKKALVGFNEGSNYPTVLNKTSVNQVLNSDAKIANFAIPSEPNEKNRIVCSFSPVKNNGELKGKVCGYKSNEEALEDTIKSVKLPKGKKIYKREVDKILRDCKQNDPKGKDSMCLILLEGIIAQNNWEKTKKTRPISKEVSEILGSKANMSNILNYGTQEVSLIR